MKFMMEWDSNSIINKWTIRQLQDAKKERTLYAGIFWKVTFGSELVFGFVVIDMFRPSARDPERKIQQQIWWLLHILSTLFYTLDGGRDRILWTVWLRHTFVTRNFCFSFTFLVSKSGWCTGLDEGTKYNFFTIVDTHGLSWMSPMCASNEEHDDNETGVSSFDAPKYIVESIGVGPTSTIQQRINRL